MAEVNYVELYAAAIEAGGGNSVVFPDGDNYKVRVGSIKKGSAKSGAKPQVGIRLVVLEGAYQGQSTWVNQTFTADNPAAVGIFLRIMEQFGAPKDAIAAGTPPLQLADYIVPGTEGIASLGSHKWGDKDFQDIKKFTITGVTPQTQAPQLPQAQPQPQVVMQAPVIQVPSVFVAPEVVAVPQPQPVVVQPAQPVVVQPVAGVPPF